MLRIEKAAVLGAGTMGAQIAAHLANAHIPVLLLDIVPRELTPEEEQKGLTLDSRQVRNRIAAAGLEAARRARMRCVGVLSHHPELQADIVVRTLEELPPTAFDDLLG